MLKLRHMYYARTVLFLEETTHSKPLHLIQYSVLYPVRYEQVIIQL
jgi:hypothetical protein